MKRAAVVLLLLALAVPVMAQTTSRPKSATLEYRLTADEARELGLAEPRTSWPLRPYMIQSLQRLVDDFNRAMQEALKSFIEDLRLMKGYEDMPADAALAFDGKGAFTLKTKPAEGQADPPKK